MTYIATIRHHSISHARAISIAGTLTEAKRRAAIEFADEQRDYAIVIFDAAHPDPIATRKVGGRKWRDLD